MTVLIPSPTIIKLAKVCAMFSSPYEGERATAAALADQIVKASGLTWENLLGLGAGKARYSTTNAGKITTALACPEALTPWEISFCKSISKQRWSLTPKQQATLDKISRKVAAYSAARRAA
jgi:hypothetical protein